MWTYFRVNYIGTEDGRNVFVGLITDSSKERLLEEKSRINEEMYHIAFNQSNVFLLEYDHRSKQDVHKKNQKYIQRSVYHHQQLVKTYF